MPIIISYIKKNWIYTILIVYFITSIALKYLNIIDITIPCIFKTITGHSCWGCGLTRATLNFYTFNWKTAWDYNPLVFIVIPSITYYILNDFYLFYKQNGKY